MRKNYKIKNARLVDAFGERFGDIYVLNGKISIKEAPFEEEIDAGGKVVMPALIDTHTHLRDPGLTYKESLETGMRAALKGGYSYLCAMANTKPVLETPEMVLENHRKAKALRLCGLMQCAAAGKNLEDKQPTDWQALSHVTKVLSNDGQTIFSDDFMRKLLIASKEHDFIISTHCQPERRIVNRDIALLKEVGGNLHVGHISHRETLQAIASAKEEGLAITCEVMPHHLFAFDLSYKVNPPIRERADVEALIEGIKNGQIDCLATDHAPHSEEDKQNGMAGISNIEHALQIFLQVFYENAIPLTRLSRMASYTPGRLLELNKGLLEDGYDADLVMLDLDAEMVIRKDEMISKSHNTPFDGRQVRGQIYFTMVEGEIRYAYHGRA